jgi:hypothetical protein
MSSGNVFTQITEVSRHNSIRDFVVSKTAQHKDFQVIEGPSIETPSGTLKPDLIIIHQQRVHVVNITVHHKDMGYLKGGYEEKITTVLIQESYYQWWWGLEGRSLKAGAIH